MMRVYSYSCGEPLENNQMVYDQLRLAHAYQCALIAIERHRRAVVDRMYRQACPAEWCEFEAADAAVVSAIDRARMSRSTSGDMLEPDEDMKRERAEESEAAKILLTAARERQKNALQAWKAAKKAATPVLRRILGWIKLKALARNKRAYNRAGTVNLAWGTRLRVAEFVERAAEASQKVGSLPKFPRFDGGGMISVQLQKGLSTEEAFESDTRFQLERCSFTTRWMNRPGLIAKNGRPIQQPDPNSKRSARRQPVIARLRTGSTGRMPIWAAWSVNMDRPLPNNAKIKWAQVRAHRVGARMRWRLLIVVDEIAPSTKAAGATLAINFGWRNLSDGGLRVAYAVGTDGYEEEVRVPPEYITGIARVDSLRGHRDQRFEVLKKDLHEWADERECPDWFTEATRYIDQWRRQARLVSLLREWSRKRFVGDETIFQAVVAWERKDHHLRFWECDERAKLLRRRQDFYRCVAARWADRYARVITANTDLRDFAEALPPEEGARSEGSVQRRSRMLAAPSELRNAVKNACAMRGTTYEEKKGAYKTQTCHVCGIVFAFAARQDLVHTCECGARWDQDRNHDLNLLASDKVIPDPRTPLAATVIDGKKLSNDITDGRWKRRRSQKDVQTSVNIAKVR